MSSGEVVVPGWPAPRGYANGRTGTGGAVHVAGQIGVAVCNERLQGRTGSLAAAVLTGSSSRIFLLGP